MNDRQEEREDRILVAGEALLARFGRHGITFAMLAGALQITTSSLRWHYADLDALLAAILRTHLKTVSLALAQITTTGEARGPALRAAYLAATRTAAGNLTPAHILLTRDRAFLPDDELPDIDATCRSIAQLLATGGHPEAMNIADTPWITAARIEQVLSAMEGAELPIQAPQNTKGLPANIARAIETGDLAYLRPVLDPRLALQATA
jgi:AcrR family transcriptional regulator